MSDIVPDYAKLEGAMRFLRERSHWHAEQGKIHPYLSLHWDAARDYYNIYKEIEFFGILHPSVDKYYKYSILMKDANE